MPEAGLSQLVRDLLWVVNSPSFVAGANVAPASQLSVEDVDEQRLTAFLGEAPRYRVGRYFEQLLHFWLEHIRGVEMVASSLQLRDGKVTIGELDFLYRDESEKLVHCEASVKFFLHLEGFTPSAFPGPNATDNYERKINKIFDSQLPRSAPHVEGVDLRHAFVKGMMFYRGAGSEPDQLPDRLPQNHLRGDWIRVTELDRLDSYECDLCAVATKPHWLAPVGRERCIGLPELRADLREHFTNGRAHPVMLSMRSAATPEAETRRLFIVDDVWPQRT